jgi:hypothetical protein
VRTITLEILRHGPPHNQLLSPLTQYLALCENHAAVTISVPYEHAQFLHRLRALSYELDEAGRRFQLEDTGREIGQLLARIPSLIAEINQRAGVDKGELLHLRMIVSASELALLPFEIAISPNGFPGEARSLVLQTSLPLCITRQVRQSSVARPAWNCRPRILFAAAAPEDGGPIPLESHLLALRQAIDPWVHHFANDEERQKMIEQNLVVLPNATIEQIREQCATGRFTHVHLLAHGLIMSPQNRLDYQYGLVLHDSGNSSKRQLVNGRSLARALRTDRENGDGPAQPLVVTLASCFGGAHPMVDFAGAGASVAHALHAEGIPLVIASQFPLSFRGSVRMVELLYPGLLAGEDPRGLLHDLRGQLHTLIPEAHDWGSVVVYAALDGQFDRELERFQVDQSHRAIIAALDHADKVIHWDDDEATPPVAGLQWEDAVKDARRRVESAKQRLIDLRAGAEQNMLAVSGLAETTDQRDRRVRAQTHLAYISGLIAAAEKRHSELPPLPDEPGVVAGSQPGMSTPSPTTEKERLLERSLDAYWEAYFYDRSNTWALVQHLFIQCVHEPRRPLPQERGKSAVWETALNASLADTKSNEAERELWARASLLELRLLQEILKSRNTLGLPATNEAIGNPEEHISRILVLSRGNEAALYSIRRQIRRYTRSENNFGPIVSDEAKKYAQRLRKEL